MKTVITIVLFVLAVPLTANAQHVNFGALDADEPTNVATLTTGAEHGLVLGAGYARALSVADRPLVLGGDIALQWAEVDARDFRLRVGAHVPLVGAGRWKLIGGLTSTLRGTSNEITRMINIGSDVAVLAGYYSPRWFAAVEAGFDWALATHIEHSDTYRMQVYADARDGWYGNTGGSLRYGVQAGVSFAHNDVILRAGRLHDIEGTPAMFPLYGTLTYDRRW